MWDWPIAVFSWISFIQYLFVISFILTSRSRFKAQQTFLDVVLLNSIADCALFIYVEFGVRARKFRLIPLFQSEPPEWLAIFSVCTVMILRTCTFLGYVTLSVNRFTAIYYPLDYCDMWSKRRSVGICLFNWVFSISYILPVLLIGNAKAYYYLSPLQTYEIAFTSGTGMLSLFTSIAIIFFTTMICLLFYVLTGIILLKAKLINKNVAHIGSAEVRYLVYALVTFIPLLFELLRSIVESYPAFVDLHGRNELANHLWMPSHELMISAQFWTLLFVTRIHRIVYRKVKHMIKGDNSLRSAGTVWMVGSRA